MEIIKKIDEMTIDSMDNLVDKVVNEIDNDSYLINVEIKENELKVKSIRR